MDERLRAEFRSIPALVLGPLAGAEEEVWRRAPPGKWEAARIVEHLVKALEVSSKTLAERAAKPPGRRRRRTIREWVAFTLVHRLAWVPAGTEAPAVALPDGALAPAEAARRLEEAVAGLVELAERLGPRASACFARHPFLGDMSLDEWLAFHLWHCRHHARQIATRAALTAPRR